MVHIDNVYKFSNADITGTLCKTNAASNTAFRGFGGPQGMFAAETVVKHVAETFGFDVDQVDMAISFSVGKSLTQLQLRFAKRTCTMRETVARLGCICATATLGGAGRSVSKFLTTRRGFRR
jgi:xanthine dehydrogenase molybdopterin-binding subunit B